MAAKKKVSSAKKSTKKVTKTVKAKPAKAKAASNVVLVGEPLVQHVLKHVKIDPAVAAATTPSEGMSSYKLDAARLVEAYAKARQAFSKVPTIQLSLTDAAEPLLAHVKQADRAWQKARHLAKQGANRGSLRKDAETLRKVFLKTCRFLYRNQPTALAEVDRIALGEGLPDLIQDMEDIAVFAEGEAEVFAAVPKLVDMAEQARAYQKSLEKMKDTEAAKALLATRNRAVQALDKCLAEVRSAADYLCEDNAAALAPYVSSSALRMSSTRSKRAKKHEKQDVPATKKPKAPTKPAEPVEPEEE